MYKPQSIEIIIDKPCQENWEAMSLAPQGRFCNACSRTVIDFTAWSDADLYRFFAKNAKAQICGRFLNTQLNKPISIPYQPHSRLYRMTLALGLTLICTQTPALLAQNRPPVVAQTVNTEPNKITLSAGEGAIYGRVSDEKKEPLINATVLVYQGDKLMGGNVTDYDGNYIIRPLDAGNYDVLITYEGYDSAHINNVPVNRDSVKQDMVMEPKYSLHLPMAVTMGWKRPLIDMPVTLLSGRVTDENGQILTGAEVQVYSKDGLEDSRTTERDGSYSISDLEPGNYTLHILPRGYKMVTIKNITINSGRTSRDIVIDKKYRIKKK